ncbi:MAG: hypothetical protein KC776_03830 [Myxococcales bacterium]|nr:hypothetical protein [Myxococcales bacterium]
MKTVGFSVLFSVTALVLGACSSSSGGGSGGSGGSGAQGGGGFGGFGATGAVGGTGATGAVGGSGGGVNPTDCTTLCQKQAAANCPNDDLSTCESDCNNPQGLPANCASAWATAIACAASTGTASCDTDGTAKISGCDAEGQAVLACVQGGTGGSGGGTGGVGGGTGGGGGGTVTLPAGCVNGGLTVNCNPVDNSPCSSTAGAACDLSNAPGLECFPDGNTAQPGASCDPNNGLYCIGGYTCGQSNTCEKWCCSDSDCGGGTCTALDPNVGTLGSCSNPG